MCLYIIATISPQIEPFFVTVALLDLREGRKISADFHVDLNHEVVRKMLSCGNLGDQGLVEGNDALQENGFSSPAEKKTEDCHLNPDLENWLRFPKQVTKQIAFAVYKSVKLIKIRHFN